MSSFPPSSDEDTYCIAHEPCPSCSSSDNLARYNDGHAYCFTPGCDHYEPPTKGNKTSSTGSSGKKPKGLLEIIDIPALSKRHINQRTVEKFGYGRGKLANQWVQIAPYRDQKGAVVAQHVRFANKDFIWRGRAKGLQLFGQHLWSAGGKKVVVTEGEIDCLTVSQLQDNKWPVVSITSGVKKAPEDFKVNLEWLESFDEVIIMFDQDEPGQKAAVECGLVLSPGKAKIATLPLKDANECHLAGKSKDVIQAIWQARSYRPDGIINGAELWEKVKEPPKPGFIIPFQELNDLTMGIREKEILLFTAGSGIGKSTLVNEISAHLAKEHDQVIGILALEESPERTARRYLTIEMNKPIHLTHGGVTEEEMREAFDATFGTEKYWLYEHFGSSDIDTLLAKIRYMIVGLGCNFIILDHISIVVSGLDEIGESERKVIDKLMTRLRALIEETGAGCLAVVHLKRPKDGKSYNEGRAVSLTDLRGSGSLEQLSDIVVALERNQQADGVESDVSIIRVLKNRPVGKCGEAGAARYYHETGRLLPYEDNPFNGESDIPGGSDF